MIAAPKPAMVWKVRLGSTTTVGAVLGASVKSTVPASLRVLVPSGVVIQTRAEAGPGAGRWAVAAWAGASADPVRAAAASVQAAASRALRGGRMGSPRSVKQHETNVSSATHR